MTTLKKRPHTALMVIDMQKDVVAEAHERDLLFRGDGPGGSAGQGLDKAGVGRLAVTGAETDVCIRSTIHGAFARGYDVTLVSDAHTTGDRTQWGAPAPSQVIAHTNLYWTFQTAPGRSEAATETGDITFAD